MNYKKTCIVIIFVALGIIPIRINAGRGCCSSHGGVSGCSASGRQVCNDGTLSPSCTCTPPAIYGCTDYKAKNYNSSANNDDGSCTYYIYGCTDSSAQNYNPSAEKNDGSCEYAIVEKDTSENIMVETENSNYYSNDKKDIQPDEESDPLSTVIGLGTIAGGVYAYKKIRKK